VLCVLCFLLQYAYTARPSQLHLSSAASAFHPHPLITTPPMGTSVATLWKAPSPPIGSSGCHCPAPGHFLLLLLLLLLLPPLSPLYCAACQLSRCHQQLTELTACPTCPHTHSRRSRRFLTMGEAASSASTHPHTTHSTSYPIQYIAEYPHLSISTRYPQNGAKCRTIWE
jgi:hypothetical protein